MTVLVRIKKLLKAERLKVDELAALTNIPYSRWANVLAGKAKIRHIEVEALGNAFPEYRMWLAFGETIPNVGQISPE